MWFVTMSCSLFFIAFGTESVKFRYRRYSPDGRNQVVKRGTLCLAMPYDVAPIS
jgi:hypothetical protein